MRLNFFGTEAVVIRHQVGANVKKDGITTKVKVALGMMMTISSYFSVCIQLACLLFTRHRQRQAQLLAIILIASRSHNTKTNKFIAVSKKFKPEWRKRLDKRRLNFQMSHPFPLYLVRRVINSVKPPPSPLCLSQICIYP